MTDTNRTKVDNGVDDKQIILLILRVRRLTYADTKNTFCREVVCCVGHNLVVVVNRWE